MTTWIALIILALGVMLLILNESGVIAGVDTATFGYVAIFSAIIVYAQELAQTADFKADLRAGLGLPTFNLVLASGVDVAKARAALLMTALRYGIIARLLQTLASIRAKG